MKRVVTLLLSIAGLCSCHTPSKGGVAADSKSEASAKKEASSVPAFISGAQQFTFGGARAGEGYFSPDGRRLIFQSEREPGNPFYQMYVMDLASGATHRVSPGQGKTTCGWIHPNGKHVLFSSTHADPLLKSKAEAEYAERQHPKQRYSWNFDDTYDIYQADIDGRNLKNLTHTKGYNAEGSYSPDGRWIAFASNRRAFSEELSAEEKTLFQRDPSYLMDIYIMRADGSGVRRLTTEAGYDGGPFFSPDGKRIIYRHFTPDGRTAEIHSMNIDGQERQQLTHLGVMSWAPFYHPSGEYFIFASNKFGFGNFELFISDIHGQHEPVRVTAMEGFDGLPVFSPDGQMLLWTHTNEKGEAQLYRAHWNDALARAQLGLPPQAPKLKIFSPEITTADARQWVEYLANPYFEGRLTGNPKESQYIATLAQAFRDMELQTEIQAYDFTSGIELGSHNTLTMAVGAETQTLELKKDWIPLSYSKTGNFGKALVAFAGYGLVASATNSQPAFDSYGDLDVHGKWVLVFNGLPDSISNERRFFLHLSSRLQHKALVAKNRGAAGLIIVEDGVSPAPALTLSFEGRSDNVGLPVVRLSAEAAERLFKATGSSRAEWTKQLSNGSIATAIWPSISAQAQVDLQLKTSKTHNILALLPAPQARQTVIVGAHLDHLGHGELGNSLAPNGAKVHPGADDNASGVAGVMEIAHALKSKQKQLKQNVLFALWTGEEIGILGSSFFANHNTRYDLSASLNLDMIGRYRDSLSVQGLGSAPQWKELVERVGIQQANLTLQTQDDPYLPSDALTFYMKQLPSIMLFTGSHPEYHTPQDQADTLNYDGLSRVASYAEKMALTLASSKTSLVTYQKVDGSPKSLQPNRGFRLYLGTIPDYTRELKNGVAITGTSKDSPAEKAGLQAGDILLELGGMKISNLYDYVYCLQALKANEATRMRFLRAGQEREVEITPVPKLQ